MAYTSCPYVIRVVVVWSVIFGIGVSMWIDVVHDALVRRGLWSAAAQAWLVLFVAYLIFAVVTVGQAWRAYRGDSA